jgi:sec-independent protein translocase protein TatC
LKTAGYAALLLVLPVFIYQAYAFIVPAFKPGERKVARPLVLMVPVLFFAGVAFCYLVVLTPALDFLLSFNASEFNTRLRASDYYDFAIMLMVAMGLGFQGPVGVLALTRLGVVSVEQLRHNRRYAALVIAVIAALLPTLDPLTLVLEMAAAALRGQHPARTSVRVKPSGRDDHRYVGARKLKGDPRPESLRRKG